MHTACTLQSVQSAGHFMPVLCPQPATTCPQPATTCPQPATTCLQAATLCLQAATLCLQAATLCLQVGHFVPEHLPKALMMHSVLPAGVQILLADSPVAQVSSPAHPHTRTLSAAHPCTLYQTPLHPVLRTPHPCTLYHAPLHPACTLHRSGTWRPSSRPAPCRGSACACCGSTVSRARRCRPRRCTPPAAYHPSPQAEVSSESGAIARLLHRTCLTALYGPLQPRAARSLAHSPSRP